MSLISIKSQRQQKSSFQPRVPKSRKEEQEFGSGQIDIVMCKECGAVYYYKSWHHRLEDYPELSEEKRIKFTLCPACQMIKDKMYEGQVILKKVPTDKKEEILNLVKNVGERAYQRDPLDRIIKIQEQNGEVEILTTENQLAVSIGKQVKRAFKGDLEIKWSHQESTVRVIWQP
jgi:NMD protein affecting ribosome stability and mRNA decay